MTFSGTRLAAAAGLLFAGFSGPAAASDQVPLSPAATSKQVVSKNRLSVSHAEAFPPGVKERGDKLWASASAAARAWVNQQAPFLERGSSDPETAALAAVQARWPNLRPAERNTVAFLLLYRAAADLRGEIQNQLDSKSQLGETESLRLQMAMDRVSKFMTALSNLLKKLSDTADGIVQNLK